MTNPVLKRSKTQWTRLIKQGAVKLYRDGKKTTFKTFEEFASWKIKDGDILNVGKFEWTKYAY